MSRKDLDRIAVVARVVAGKVSADQAAEFEGLTVRQVWRQVKVFRMEGAEGLIHGNRGRPSLRRLPAELQERACSLLQKEYADYNTRHALDELTNEHGITVSYATLYRWRCAMGQRSPRRHAPQAHRRRRERAPRPGQLVQTDGSDHQWLEGRGPKLCLIAFIDDATSMLLGALFRAEEDAVGYMEVLEDVCQRYGIPAGLYSDRHTIFKSPKEATLEQKLNGEVPLSHFGRTLQTLGIAHLVAQSPQAKGRVERLFGTLQDRLVKELRRRGACTLAEANRVLAAYLPKFNARFARPPASPETCFSPWPEHLSRKRVFACHYTRIVANDNTIAFDGLKLPIPPTSHRHNWPRARVDVYLHYSGTLSIEYQRQPIASFLHDPNTVVRVDHFVPATPITYAPTPAQPRPKAPSPQQDRTLSIPASDHPWRHSPIGRNAQEP